MLTSITVDIVAARSMQWPGPGLSTGSHVEWKEALDPAQREIAALLPDGPFTVDALVAKGVAPRDAVAAMTMLEIYGILTSRPGGIYEKK